MPVIDAKHESACAACGQGILIGESIEYSRELGPRHLACTDKAAEPRRNQYRARCQWCSARVKVGAGLLKVVETPRGDGTYERRNVVSCADGTACSARCEASLVRGLPHRPQR